MKYQRDRKGTAALLLSSQLRKPLTLAGTRVMRKAQQNVRHRSGATAASARLIQKSRAGVRGDRIGVSVVFGRAMVPLQFGNQRTRATRPLTRALIE
jgi:hypothetical protein